MRLTRRLSRTQRYAASSVVAFAAHWSLACALPTRSPHDAEATPTLVWLEAAPLANGMMTLPAEGDAGATTLAAQAPAAAVRPQVQRRRDMLRATAGRRAPRTAHASTELDTATPAGDLEVAEPSPEAETGPLDASMMGQTAAGAESDVALAGSAGSGLLTRFGASGESGLVHGPILRAATSCAGYFPVDARTGRGEVEIDVTVDAGGHARESHVLNEQPFGQGFGVAARGCVQTLSFAPAVDRSGAAVSGHAKLRLRFARPFTT